MVAMWTFLAVFAFVPACLASDHDEYTTTTISLPETIIFYLNDTTREITIDSPDRRDWILCDPIFGGKISASIGGVTTSYNLSNPFVYRQNKRFIKHNENTLIVSSSDPIHELEENPNGWLQVNGIRNSFPYGESGAESPIRVALEDDSLTLNTSIANVEVVRRSQAQYSEWKWQGIERFHVMVPGNAAMVKYLGENRAFVSQDIVMNYYSDLNIVKTSTLNSGSYTIDLNKRGLAYTTQRGRVHILNNYYSTVRNELTVKSDGHSITVSNKEPISITHNIWSSAAYRVTRTDCWGGNSAISYHYNISSGTVELQLFRKTVIIVNVRRRTVKGRGRYEERTRIGARAKNGPERVWYSTEFKNRVEFSGPSNECVVKIYGRWTLEIGPNVVKSEPGTTTWTYDENGQPANISYVTNDGGDEIGATTDNGSTSVWINDFHSTAVADAISWKINDHRFVQLSK